MDGRAKGPGLSKGPYQRVCSRGRARRNTENRLNSKSNFYKIIKKSPMHVKNAKSYQLKRVRVTKINLKSVAGIGESDDSLESYNPEEEGSQYPESSQMSV